MNYSLGFIYNSFFKPRSRAIIPLRTDFLRANRVYLYVELLYLQYQAILVEALPALEGEC
jgi:hypothetical protein